MSKNDFSKIEGTLQRKHRDLFGRRVLTVSDGEKTVKVFIERPAYERYFVGDKLALSHIGKRCLSIRPVYDKKYETLHGDTASGESLMQYDTEPAEVRYNRDDSCRLVVLRREDGKYAYLFEQLYGIDDKDESWLPEGSMGVNLFDSAEKAVEAAMQDPRYKAKFK